MLSTMRALPTGVKWFQSYLSEITQCVRIGSSFSSPLIITPKVPQSAVLSLLFFIYTNDLLETSLCGLLESYVDDFKLLFYGLYDAVLLKESYKGN